jgi:hypothetical protein
VGSVVVVLVCPTLTSNLWLELAAPNELTLREASSQPVTIYTRGYFLLICCYINFLLLLESGSTRLGPKFFAHSTMAPRAATRKSKRSSSKSIAGQVASPIGSPRAPLRNSASITEETERELLKVLLGPLGKVKRHYQVYDQNPRLFGEKNSTLRKSVHSRRRYIDSIREDDEEEFERLFQHHFPGEAPPPLVESEKTSSSAAPINASMAHRNARAAGK